MADNYYKDKAEHNGKNLPQYGKKGHRPRAPYSRKEVSLDDIRTNDISYWNKTSGFDQVTKFNWDLIIGNPRNPRNLIPSGFTNLKGNINPCQVMSISVAIGPGWASDVGDGVNRSLAQLMAKIRANLSTSNIGFETADLGIMLASTSSIAALIGYAKRILECYNMWKDRNYVYPRALIAAQNCNYNDIMAHINEYTMRLNASIDMYNNMSLLDCFDIYDRQYSMFHNVFVDEDSQYGQLYIFQPNNFYKYDDSAHPAPSYAKSYNTFTEMGSQFTQLLNIINTMIDRWYGSSDLYQINGTLLRAFKDAPRQQIPHHVVENSISPVVDRAFLMQIMNCTVHGQLDFDSLDITQEPSAQNYLIWKPYLDDSGVFIQDCNNTEVMLRLFEDDIPNDDNMEMTRLVNFVNGSVDGDGKYRFTGCGSEIVTGIILYNYNAITNSSTQSGLFKNLLYFGDTPADIINAETMAQLMPFRYIPCVHLIHKSGADTIYQGILGDVYNWMLYTRKDWLTLQFVAYQSLWTPKNGI